MTHRYALLLIAVSCMLDLSLWALLQSPFPYFSRALFYTLIGVHASIGTIGVAGLMALIPFFYLTGILGTDLLVLLPLGAAYYYVREIADVPKPVFVGAVFCAVALQSALLEGVVGGVPFSSRVLLFSFLSALIMVYLSTGSQGNRLHV